MNPSERSSISLNLTPEEEHLWTMADFNWRKKFPLLFSFVSLRPVGVAVFLFLRLTYNDTKKMRHLQPFRVIYLIGYQIDTK